MTEAPQALPGLAVVAQLKAAVDIAEVMPWETEADRPKLESWARQSLREACTIDTIRSILALIAQQQRNLDAALADAERYRLLRRKVCIIGAHGGSPRFHILNLDPVADWRNDNASTILDDAIDTARAALAPGAAGSTTKDAK